MVTIGACAGRPAILPDGKTLEVNGPLYENRGLVDLLTLFNQDGSIVYQRAVTEITGDRNAASITTVIIDGDKATMGVRRNVPGAYIQPFDLNTGYGLPLRG